MKEQVEDIFKEAKEDIARAFSVGGYTTPASRR